MHQSVCAGFPACAGAIPAALLPVPAHTFPLASLLCSFCFGSVTRLLHRIRCETAALTAVLL